ncbi:type II toxin-antitoxin system VapC family toxin [Nocardia lasii]|uniref:Type II toxin-antitoxin system VapC family toxin n=1 Tax=Nocardia lasii TaxID=1616107 RepID=A0ABW1JQA3_9NOCA
MLVVDASAMCAALLWQNEFGQRARLELGKDTDWVAPSHLPLEVVRTLRKAVLSRYTSQDDANEAFRALAYSGIEYIGVDSALLARMWALSHNVSSYDAAYLVVAAENESPLVTCDVRLAEAAEQAKVDVEVRVVR